MYEKFFYLKENPFHITPDPKFLYLSKSHREAIDLLLFGIKERKGFILLTGEVGTGKTTLCRALLEKLPKNTETALILNPVLSGKELLENITGDFGLGAKGGSIKAHLDALNGFLLKRASAGVNAAVIIDEAQNMTPGALEMVRLLSNIETDKHKLIQLLLVGQPELKKMLSLHELRQLNQRIAIRCNLSPLDLAETKAYIQTRLAIAGGRHSVRFAEEALAVVFRASRGIPRAINIVCDRALTAAFIAGKREVLGQEANRAVEELERDGFITQRAQAGGERGIGRYRPHIALSAFLIALIAGIFLGPALLRTTLSLAGGFLP
ncbi:MAG: AAA family ATPase [Deltaproteobacteria bacterium]|nr:AAA family ATPase [Deltaproteobacteria bacterium]